ncbi:terminase small subunit [Acinetobacter proteolyticus]|uniref:terminase small subunit n=1 Tax=Acinetobacter proteolyticus TaxID=1776741 RepID=UPI003D9566DD
MSKLTAKQQLFVDEYLIDLNATQAAIRAGYSPRTAYSKGQKLTKILSEQISEAQTNRSKRTHITQDMVLNELAKIGFSNMLDYVTPTNGGDLVPDFSAVTRDQAAAISEVSVEEYVEGRGEDSRLVKRTKFKLSDKRAALVDMGRHLGMFKDRIDITTDGEPINKPTVIELVAPHVQGTDTTTT